MNTKNKIIKKKNRQIFFFKASFFSSYMAEISATRHRGGGAMGTACRHESAWCQHCVYARWIAALRAAVLRALPAWLALYFSHDEQDIIMQPLRELLTETLKEQSHKILNFRFFHEPVSLKPLSIPLGPLRFFFENSRRSPLPKVHHRCRWHRWQIFNQKSFNFIYCLETFG